MAHYRSKPFEIEATQFNGPGDHPAVALTKQSTIGPIYHVNGKQGAARVDIGDWIITEPDGSGHYPCKPDVFAAKYEPIS